MCGRLSSDHGQASVEWLAVVGLVAAVLLAGAAGALPGAEALPRAIGATFARAFCLVSGGDCLSGVPRPCVVRSESRSRERRATVAVVRTADGRTVLREERSDGTVAVSVEDRVRGGGGLSLLRVAGVFADVRGGEGRRFVVADRAAADRLVARLDDEPSGARGIVSGGGGGPVPDERWWTLGGGGEVVLRGPAVVDARAASEGVGGIRERTRTGERTLVLRRDGGLVGALAGPFVRLGLGAAPDVTAELALDRDRRPVSLTVRAAYGADAEARAGSLRTRTGDLLEAEARLDLADPAVRALAAELASGSLDAARELASRLAERARVDLRVYDLDATSDVSGGSVPVLPLGYEVEEVVRQGRLVDAIGHEPGLGWSRRLDCLGVA